VLRAASSSSSSSPSSNSTTVPSEKGESTQFRTRTNYKEDKNIEYLQLEYLDEYSIDEASW
jgi:hypothetical protein